MRARRRASTRVAVVRRAGSARRRRSRRARRRRRRAGELGDEVGDRERRRARARRRPSAAPSAPASQRCGGHTSVGAFAGRRGEHVGVGVRVVRARTTAPACGPRTATPRRAQRPRRARRSPTSCRPRCRCRRRATSVTATASGRRTRRRARASRRSTCASVCAAESVTRSRDVPGATVGGRIAGTSRPRSSSAARRGERALLLAARRTARSATGGRAGAGRRARAGARRARRLRRERSTRERGERGRGVGRRRRGREDVRPARGSRRARRSAPGPATKPPSDAERLRQRADAQHVGVGGRTSTRGPEHRVRLVEHEQRALAARTASTSASTSAASPSIENTVSLTTSARRRAAVAEQRARDGRGRGGGRPRRRRGASRQPSMIDAWFSSSEQTSTPGPPNVVSTPRFAAKPVGKSAARGVAFHAASSCSSSRVDRARADDRAGPSRARCPSGRARRARPRHRRVRGEAEVVVRRERDDGAAVGGERAFRARGVEVARRAPAAGGADRPSLARRPTRPRSCADLVADLVDRVGERVARCGGSRAT